LSYQLSAFSNELSAFGYGLELPLLAADSWPLTHRFFLGLALFSRAA
jgi:hypothetical protein